MLIVPVSIVFLLKEVERSLADNLKQNLQLSAELISYQFAANAEWFDEAFLPSTEDFIAPEIVVFLLNQAVQLDGELSDWQSLEKYRKYFGEQQELGVLLGSLGDRFYLSITLEDESIIYCQSAYACDQLVISFLDKQNNPQRLFIAPTKEGQVTVKVKQQDKFIELQNFNAFWKESPAGISLEIAFAQGISPGELRVSYFDTDLPRQTTYKQLFASNNIELNPLVWTSKSINQFVSKLSLLPGQRLWILDQEGRMLARNGDLNPQTTLMENNFLTNWLFNTQNQPLADKRNYLTRLNSGIIYDALNGRAFSTIESYQQDSYSIALAAAPIIIDKNIFGAVFIEENIAKIQFLQRKTLVNILYLCIGIFAIIFILLLFYSNRMVKRVKQLKTQINQVVDNEGRMNQPLKLKFVDGDEIDELSNAFMHMGNKLYDYNHYLEKLASRLSHEIRTPIAIVRSSLDNLLIDCPDKETKNTIQRAIQGTERLGEIVTRMRQASNIKQAMQVADLQDTDLPVILQQLVDGFNQSFTEYDFEFISNKKTIIRKISADLIAEMLDKLLSNAMDFSHKGTPIIIELLDNEKHLMLSVSNQGEPIAKENLKSIFNSLISYRKEQRQTTANLGLGLYLVKLIAGFHGAVVKAENLPKDNGVKFSVIWKKRK